MSFPESLAFGMLFAATCLVVGKLYGHWRLRTGQFQPEEFLVRNAIEHGVPLPDDADGEVVQELLRRRSRAQKRSLVISALGAGLWSVGLVLGILEEGADSIGWTEVMYVAFLPWSLWDTARRLTRIRALLAQVDALRRSGRPAHSSAHSADTVRVHRRSAS
ncbi:hypothetical protein QM806_27650 [Rhodococcus sp. IEGM 1351]|uniref:hypothetical protein n=1 Tax=Rhodococcus sp. IEGM 1351 TaxID=3047089 RepID=UPI0022F30527|nr:MULTISPECIES: hypothetical protein [Rhodococcus]MDI9939166.1 hypothetical protein [Rhodococcus sp. IEGM 1351]GLK39050.1 hypothetical protein GCM10017611_59200 [Rhodococcus wratislaviensis]